ncbi:polysaccharide deacetylase family protein [Flexibacter flexilis]|uniref:polysaccharide deacetylase family protein n=1 Tax=Flexibacter flexilis TaxID=998 RepID=UPI0015A53763|nr:polysaccharide deacetylase family protein [Flexibacter flexilis]
MIFRQILGYTHPLRFTTDKVLFINDTDIKLQYGGEKHRSNTPFPYLRATPLLWQKGVQQLDISIGTYENCLTLFEVEQKNAELPFDVAAACFFLATRYEEYWPHKPDEHGRYRAEDSTAFKHHFLQKPMVNIWANQLKKIVCGIFPHASFTEQQYWFLPTFDIDSAYAFRLKGTRRTLLASASDLLNKRQNNNLQRWQTLLWDGNDPFDTYELIEQIHESYSPKPIFFWLLANYSKFDKNINYLNKDFQELIRRIAHQHISGIHPSYFSSERTNVLKEEKKRLEEIVNQTIIHSRQHYLRLQIPETYRQLMAEGIQADFTMGYSSQIGFRASLCTPFLWYDIENERITPLKIYPFAVMDVTMQQYMQLSPAEALTQTKAIIQEVKAVGGMFCSLFHNESLSEYGVWRGWVKFYKDMVAAAVS